MCLARISWNVPQFTLIRTTKKGIMYIIAYWYKKRVLSIYLSDDASRIKTDRRYSYSILFQMLLLPKPFDFSIQFPLNS